VQQRIVHLIRNSFRYAVRQHRDAIVKALRPVYTAPSEAAAIKCLHLTTRSLDPTGHGRARWAVRWKPALNAFAITFAGRFERTTH
jgi:putative transposase